MRKRGLCSRPVLVCLFVTLVDCIHTAEYIVKLLALPDKHIILVFDSLRRYPIPREPSQRGAKYTGWENLRLSNEIAVYLGNGER